jgi:hypothetical protein
MLIHQSATLSKLKELVATLILHLTGALSFIPTGRMLVIGEHVGIRRVAIAVYQYLPRRSEESYKHLVVCFLLGKSPASEVYMPTFRNTLFHLHRQVGVCLWRWNSVPKRRHINCRRRGFTQKKEYNIQNTAKGWNQEYKHFLQDSFASYPESDDTIYG